MQVSATMLGRDYGLTGEEMNRALFKLGFLEGRPGEYSPTAEGLRYAVETDHHRGTGGYSCYNRYWTTRTYDDSIKDVLNISDDLKREIRQELSQIRAARQARYTSARLTAETEFQAKMAAEAVARNTSTEGVSMILGKVEKITIIVIGVAVVGYGIYKVAPRVKAWKNKCKEKKRAEQGAG